MKCVVYLFLGDKIRECRTEFSATFIRRVGDLFARSKTNEATESVVRDYCRPGTSDKFYDFCSGDGNFDVNEVFVPKKNTVFFFKNLSENFHAISLGRGRGAGLRAGETAIVEYVGTAEAPDSVEVL